MKSPTTQNWVSPKEALLEMILASRPTSQASCQCLPMSKKV